MSSPENQQNRIDILFYYSMHGGDIRGRGLLLGIEIVNNAVEKVPGRECAERIYYSCLSSGLSFKISQGCVLTLSPPLTIGREDLDKALAIIENAIRNEAG